MPASGDPAFPSEGASIFSLRHSHSGAQGDGSKIRLANIDTAFPLAVGKEITFIPVNAPNSGRKYRLQVIEVTDPDTKQIQPVLQIIPVTNV